MSITAYENLCFGVFGLVLLRKFRIESMDLKEKVTNRLKEQYSNLGFPQDVLTSVVGVAVIGLPEEAADDVIAERIKSVEPMLKSFQSNTDKRVSEAKKAAEESFKGEKSQEEKPVDKSNEEPGWFRAYREKQEQEKSELQARIDELVGESKQKSFDDRVAIAAKKVGLKGELLVLAKASLSPDMDASALENKLGAIKKTLMESGAKLGSEERTLSMTKTEEDVARAEAKKWVEKQAEKLQQH